LHRNPPAPQFGAEESSGIGRHDNERVELPSLDSELLCGGNSTRELVSTVMASENDDARIYRDRLGAGGVSGRVEGEMAAIDNVNLR
jgi:hypothetical protein